MKKLTEVFNLDDGDDDGDVDEKPYPARYAPYPELVEKERNEQAYVVLDSDENTEEFSRGAVDMVNRKIMVPLAPNGRPTSRHEMGHVRWSPRKHPKLDFDRRVFLATEDGRVNLGLRSKRCPVDVDEAERDYVVDLALQDLARSDVGAYVLRTVASIGTNILDDVLRVVMLEEEIAHAVEPMIRHVEAELLRGRAEVGDHVTTIEHVVELARELARKLADRGWLPHGDPNSMTGCCIAKGKGRGRPARPRVDEGSVPSGTLSIVTAPLTLRCGRPKAGGRRITVTGEGAVVHAPHRLYIDGAIFRRVRRERVGSVLIDTSGSMSFTARDLDRILGPAPEATRVAIYSGSGNRGQLRIVAMAGRRARPAHLHPFAGGNVVDVPALRWLARQPGPRVWITDGGVSGVNDKMTAGIKRECAEICKRAGIRTVANATEATKVLSGAARGRGQR